MTFLKTLFYAVVPLAFLFNFDGKVLSLEIIGIMIIGALILLVRGAFIHMYKKCGIFFNLPVPKHVLVVQDIYLSISAICFGASIGINFKLDILKIAFHRIIPNENFMTASIICSFLAVVPAVIWVSQHMLRKMYSEVIVELWRMHKTK